MEILINDCPVDFELAGEKTINDIIDSISEWTLQRNLIFTETLINNENYSIDKLPDFLIKDIDTINCVIQSKADIIISSINAGIDYCGKLNVFIGGALSGNDCDINRIEHICAGLDWIVEVINKIAQFLAMDVSTIMQRDNSLADYIDEILEFKNNIHELNNKDELINIFQNDKDLFLNIIDILKMLLMSENMKTLVIQSIDSPDILLNSLLGIKEEIPNQLTNLEEISISYQTGKDDIASQKLQVFIDFIFNYSRTCYQIAPVFEIDLRNIIVDNISLDDKNNEIQDLLNEIMNVMENNDIISLSDILEYEMKSSLENLDIYIDSLIDFLSKNQ